MSLSLFRSTAARALASVLVPAAVLGGCVPAQGPGITQVRVARPTPKLEPILRFYRDGLGLPVVGGFEGHAGYDGVMFGLPGVDRHLEFTTGPAIPSATPGPENLLVFYYPDTARRDAAVARLAALGYHAVAPENPYWIARAVTVPDPDGWRVVLFAGTFVETPVSARWNKR